RVGRHWRADPGQQPNHHCHKGHDARDLEPAHCRAVARSEGMSVVLANLQVGHRGELPSQKEFVTGPGTSEVNGVDLRELVERRCDVAGSVTSTYMCASLC